MKRNNYAKFSLDITLPICPKGIDKSKDYTYVIGLPNGNYVSGSLRELRDSYQKLLSRIEEWEKEYNAQC